MHAGVMPPVYAETGGTWSRVRHGDRWPGHLDWIGLDWVGLGWMAWDWQWNRHWKPEIGVNGRTYLDTDVALGSN
jgi:hypothetical protein